MPALLTTVMSPPNAAIGAYASAPPSSTMPATANALRTGATNLNAGTSTGCRIPAELQHS